MLALTSCVATFHGTDQIGTRDLHMAVDVQGVDADTELVISLAGPAGRADLREGDTLFVSVGGEPMQVMPSTDRDGITYAVQLGAHNGPFAIELRRHADHSARVFPPLPSAAQITWAVHDGVVDLVWGADKGEHTTELTLEGDCFEPLTRPLARDTGTYTLQLAELSATPCPFMVSIKRAAEARGELGPQPGGSYEAKAVRTSTTMVTP
jgi:hypothetical protein